jgi:hypothetical protein
MPRFVSGAFKAACPVGARMHNHEQDERKQRSHSPRDAGIPAVTQWNHRVQEIYGVVERDKR